MKSSLFAGFTGLVALRLLVGCGPLAPDTKGGVQFQYVLFVDDGVGGPIAAVDCAAAGVAKVKYNIGNDDNANGILEAAEAITQLEKVCNQDDANNDGVLDAAEFGNFDSGFNIDPDTYGAFSVEFLDAANQNVQWRIFEAINAADVFTFFGDTAIVDQQNLVITFQGDGAQVAGELQAFIGI
jgi:hypothetical protein